MVVLEKIYRVDMKFAVFGIITERYNQTVIDAAPIAHWTIGKNIGYVLRRYTERGAVIQRIAYVDNNKAR